MRDCHSDTIIELAESTEILWRNYLAEFDEKVWPIYQRYGYSKDSALQHWTLGKIHDRLDAIEEIVRDLL